MMTYCEQECKPFSKLSLLIFSVICGLRLTKVVIEPKKSHFGYCCLPFRGDASQEGFFTAQAGKDYFAAICRHGSRFSEVATG